MAGIMKFNLICNDRPIRTLEQLRDNFSIEEVLDYYDHRLLHGWLEARGYRDEWRNVNAIASEDPAEIMRELAGIFGVDCDEAEIKEVCVAPESGDSMDELEREFQEYEAFESDILEHRDDWEFLRTCADELATTFYEFFKKNYYHVIIYLSEKCPMFLYAMATNPVLRPYMIDWEMLENSEVDQENIRRISALLRSDKFLNPESVRKILQDHVRVVSRSLSTDSKKREYVISEGEGKVMIVGIGEKDGSNACFWDKHSGRRYDYPSQVLPIVNGMEATYKGDCIYSFFWADYTFCYLELDGNTDKSGDNVKNKSSNNENASESEEKLEAVTRGATTLGTTVGTIIGGLARDKALNDLFNI